MRLRCAQRYLTPCPSLLTLLRLFSCTKSVQQKAFDYLLSRYAYCYYRFHSSQLHPFVFKGWLMSLRKDLLQVAAATKDRGDLNVFLKFKISNLLIHFYHLPPLTKYLYYE